MEKKPFVWTFQGTDKENLTRKVFDMAKKSKPQKTNWISSYSNWKQWHKKNELCESKKRLDATK